MEQMENLRTRIFSNSTNGMHKDDQTTGKPFNMKKEEYRFSRGMSSRNLARNSVLLAIHEE